MFILGKFPCPTKSSFVSVHFKGVKDLGPRFVNVHLKSLEGSRITICYSHCQHDSANSGAGGSWWVSKPDKRFDKIKIRSQDHFGVLFAYVYWKTPLVQFVLGKSNVFFNDFVSRVQTYHKIQCVCLSPTRKSHNLQWLFVARLESDTNYNVPGSNIW